MGGYHTDKKSFNGTITELIKLAVERYNYGYDFWVND